MNKLPQFNYCFVIGRRFFIILILFFLLVGCKKKVVLPNEELIKPDPIFKNKITPEIQAIIDLSYNWKFDKALSDIKELKSKSIADDIYLLDLLTVGTLFWQYIAAVSAEENNKAREAFSTIVGEIKTHTEDVLEKDPDNLKALYLLGFTEGSQSKFYAIEGDFFKAYRFGVKGFNRLKRIEKINPNDFDTQFGIGLYKYYCATLLPRWFQKLSVFVPGIDVDREGGLLRIQLSSKYSYLLKIEAELALAQGNSSYEREFKAGVELSEKIAKKYPDNKVFHYTQMVSLYYLGQHELFEGKPEKALKTLKKALRASNEIKSFRMHIRKKSFLTPDMKWKLDVPSEHEVIFALYREIGKAYFYMNEQEQADQILLEGAKRDILGRNIKAALYFEIGRQHKILNKKDYVQYIEKSAEVAGEGSEIAYNCKVFLGTHFVLPEPEKEIMSLQHKIIEGKALLEDVLNMKKKFDKPEFVNYQYSFYDILSHFYIIKGDHAMAEKYHDEVRYHAQLDR